MLDRKITIFYKLNEAKGSGLRSMYDVHTHYICIFTENVSGTLIALHVPSIYNYSYVIPHIPYLSIAK